MMLRATACRPAKRPSSVRSWTRWPTHRSAPRVPTGNSQYVFGIPAGAGLVEAAGLLPVVRAHDVEEGPPEQLPPLAPSASSAAGFA